MVSLNLRLCSLGSVGRTNRKEEGKKRWGKIEGEKGRGEKDGAHAKLRGSIFFATPQKYLRVVRLFNFQKRIFLKCGDKNFYFIL